MAYSVLWWDSGAKTPHHSENKPILFTEHLYFLSTLETHVHWTLNKPISNVPAAPFFYLMNSLKREPSQSLENPLLVFETHKVNGRGFKSWNKCFGKTERGKSSSLPTLVTVTLTCVERSLRVRVWGAGGTGVALSGVFQKKHHAEPGGSSCEKTRGKVTIRQMSWFVGWFDSACRFDPFLSTQKAEQKEKKKWRKEWKAGK